MDSLAAWPSPLVPSLPGTGPDLRLYDTATGALRTSSPGDPARMYVCGITPYDATHLGHAATYLAFDIAQRVWRDAGHRVHYVQNVTDIDDPLLERAAQTGERWDALAARETQLFREDMTALRVLPPDDYVAAVDAIPDIADAIVSMLERGAAYHLDDGSGDIYFPVSAAAGFGGESNYDRDTMRTLFAERGGDPQRAGKHDPLDSLLWRGERPGEPAWDSPLGRGRPGWHIECSVIALNRLGMGVDIQGGGSDLVFPHHEHSAAHAEALTGDAPFARIYAHAGMIGLDGEKMSKSRGNLVLVSKLRAAHIDPMAIRLALLDGHYRADREWTGGRLPAAESRLARWRRAVTALPSATPTTSVTSDTPVTPSTPGAPTTPFHHEYHDAVPSALALLDEVRDCLADDLDTRAAIAAIDRWADRTSISTTDADSADADPDADASSSGADSDPSRPGPGTANLVRDLVDALLGVAL